MIARLLVPGCAMLVVAVAVAEDLDVVNGGFEDPVLADDQWVVPAPGWLEYDPADIASGAHGCWNTIVEAYPEESPEGENIGYLYVTAAPGPDVVGMSQALDAVVEPGRRYVLRALVGNPAGYEGYLELTGFPGYRLELLAAETVIASDENGAAPEEGAFVSRSISYDSPAGDPLAGEAVSVRLINMLDAEGVEVDFDAVGVAVVPACTGDLDYSGSVGVNDLLALLAGWGDDAGDVTGDGRTDVSDLLGLLSGWGDC